MFHPVVQINVTLLGLDAKMILTLACRTHYSSAQIMLLLETTVVGRTTSMIDFTLQSLKFRTQHMPLA